MKSRGLWKSAALLVGLGAGLLLMSVPVSAAPTAGQSALPISASWQYVGGNPQMIEVDLVDESDVPVYDYEMTLWEALAITAFSQMRIGQAGLCPDSMAQITGNRVKICATFGKGTGVKASTSFTGKVRPCRSPGMASSALAASRAADCGVTVEATGPNGADSGPVEATYTGPCLCDEVDATVSKVHFVNSTATFQVNWGLVCTQGAGSGCQGKVVVDGPTSATFTNKPKANQKVGKAKPKSQRHEIPISCKGSCNKTTQGHKTLYWAANGAGGGPNYAGRTFVFTLKYYCFSSGVYVRVGSDKLKLVFNKSGFLDKKRSRLP